MKIKNLKYKMSILCNTIEQMAAEADDKGKILFGIRLNQEDAKIILYAMRNCNEWIDVNEKMPRDDENVLTYHPMMLKDGAMQIMKGWSIHNYVSHWMPLPEPPEVNDR